MSKLTSETCEVKYTGGYDAGKAVWMDLFILYARLPAKQNLVGEWRDNALYAFRQGMDPKHAAESLRRPKLFR